jgi:zinc and cadmium transporter
MSLVYILLASFAVMAVSFSGKLVTWRGLGPLIERNMHFFVSFAAGVLLVIAFNLSREIIEHAGSLSAGLPWIAVGAIAVLIAFRYLPTFHHHHDRGGHSHSKIDANRILASDAIHNIGDGAVIVVSFAASPIIGIASTLSIMVHEMLQEISEFFVLREAGLSVRRTLVMNFLASATILIGALGAYFLLGRFESLEIPLLGLAVGSYLIVIFHDLIPHSIESARIDAHYIRHIVFFIVGATLMMSIAVALPHEEPAHAPLTATAVTEAF